MPFEVFNLRLIHFEESWDFQKNIFQSVKRGLFSAALILCRHYPVITLGRNANRKNVLLSEAELESLGIPVYQLERGGDVTYHGPGQITVYPIFNLTYFQKDIHKFLWQLEQVAIDLSLDLGINVGRRPGLRGVWRANKKVSSIGISIRNWITFHGLSINIKRDDLKNFGLLRPCGMDIKVTSLESILNQEIDIESLDKQIINKFIDVFMPTYSLYS